MIEKLLRKIIQQLLLMFYILKKKICVAYISQINTYCKKQIILLIILNEEKEGWHYLAVKNYLHYYMEWKHKGNFYCLNCLRSLRTENKLKTHEKVCKNKVFWEF